ncbi:hypothetical protein AURDEDRAFT_186517 [Auricularia subglabra TFB-10046 SS5]|nr:hypothetical protein AURDEDRAFT_186517 [Auricularia subglabra TFB-10046 SS5]
MVSLLVSDSLQAIGAVMDLRWIRQGNVTCGGFCNAQGAIQSLGETSVAMATVVIAIHTFLVIFFRWTPPRSFLIPVIVISAIWIYVSLYSGISYARHHSPGEELFVPTPYWCWISSRYPKDRISAEYFWLWFAALFSILLYIPLFFMIRGNIEVDPQRFWRMSFHRTAGMSRKGVTFSPSQQSLKMLLYPACYILTVIPLTITRWVGFSTGNRIAPFWTFFGVSIFGLSGIVNVLLLTLTRPSILSFGASSVHTAHRTTPAAGSYPFHGSAAPGLRSESGVIGTAMSVEVRVERDMYEDVDPDLEGSYSDDRSMTKSPIITRAGSVKLLPVRPPSPVYSPQKASRTEI